jgi:hypothetical protein
MGLVWCPLNSKQESSINLENKILRHNRLRRQTPIVQICDVHVPILCQRGPLRPSAKTI